MFIEELKIHGYRGFGKEQTVKFALPNGEAGSGLTIIVGPTIPESRRFLKQLRCLTGGMRQAFLLVRGIQKIIDGSIYQ